MATPQGAMPDSGASRRLKNEYKDMQKANGDDLPGISVGLVDEANFFVWEVILMIDEDCKYYGGAFFKATLSFPADYPYMPPSLQFRDPVPFHPNIYPDGKVCISILHPPGKDETGYEHENERWSPLQSPHTILLSVISLFDEPNVESPANVEAARMLRDERAGQGNREFRKKVRACVRASLGEE